MRRGRPDPDGAAPKMGESRVIPRQVRGAEVSELQTRRGAQHLNPEDLRARSSTNISMRSESWNDILS